MDFDYLSLRNMTSYKQAKQQEDLYKYLLCNKEKIESFKYLEKEQIREWQLQRIIWLVKYSYQNIPLYKKKYDNAGIDIDGFSSWDDFFHLPILFKDEVIDGFPNDIVKNFDSYKHTVRSSGTQGKFVTIAVSDEAFYADTVMGLRQFSYQSNETFSEEDVVLFIYGAPWAIDSIKGKYRHEFVSMYGPIEDCIRAIENIHPSVIRAYPSMLIKLSSYLGNLSKYGVRSIICCSEPSTKVLRNQLEKHFGVTVLDEYASEELTRIALECPYHKYHLEEDACFVEVVDINTYKPLSYGSQGLLVGTNLINTATPLIRYSQGDIATIIGDSVCECGSNYREMLPPAGRLLDSIVLPDSSIIPGSYLIEIAYNWLYDQDIPIHGWQYQIIQEEDYSIHIYIIPYKGKAVSEDMIIGIRNSFDNLFRHNLNIEIHIVNELPHKTEKKNRVVLSKICK